MAQRSRSHYGHSPALDGLRGVFMAAFMAFHFGATFLSGMWIAINLFFVLSGFLITRLLIEERETRASIDVWGFYKRRGRRILPGLFAMLTVVTVYVCAWAPEELRARWGGDILATLGFVMNWRLIAQSDEYFGDHLIAPPLRHAWTLGIEEQYYLVIPFLVMGLVLLVRNRAARVLALVALAGLTTIWTAALAARESTGFARLYYGTDTRIASLLIGTALGIALGWTAREGIPRLPLRWVTVLGWVGLVSNVALFLLIDPFTDWMYTRGGMFFGAVGSALLILSLADPRRSAIKQLFKPRIAQWFGRLSYSLYLWHWPVHLLLGPDGLAGSIVLTGVVGFAISTLLAYLSDRFLEQPVLRGGIKALLPRLRVPMAAVFAPIVAFVMVCATVLLPTSAAPTGSQTTVMPAAITRTQPEYSGTPAAFAMLGDSVPWYLTERFPRKLFPQAKPVNLASEGCDLLDRPLLSVDGIKDQHGACKQNMNTWGARLRESGAASLVVWGSPLLASAHQMPDGSKGLLGNPAYEQLILQTYDRIWQTARANGARTVDVVNVPCRRFGAAPDSQEYQKLQREQPGYVEEFNDPVRLNGLLARWVSSTPGARLIDLHSAICPEGRRDSINGITVFNDGLHFSPEFTPTLWRWLLGQLSARA